MYVSTAYSNSHVKRYSLVKEQLYPLKDQEGNVADHKAIVERLLGMPDDEAMQEVGPLPCPHVLTPGPCAWVLCCT